MAEVIDTEGKEVQSEVNLGRAIGSYEQLPRANLQLIFLQELKQVIGKAIWLAGVVVAGVLIWKMMGNKK